MTLEQFLKEEEAQTEITQPIIEHAWLDINSTPDSKTGIQRLKIELVLNNEVKKELYNGYYKEGLVCHSHNLTWMFNSYKERLTNVEKKLAIAKEALEKINEKIL